MPDRASPHAQAIANLKKFREAQATARERLTAELAQAEADYREWCEPKRRFERLRNELATFEVADTREAIKLEGVVNASADPRIHAALFMLARMQEENSLAFESWGDTSALAARNTRLGIANQRTHNGAAVNARLQAILKARDELRHLLTIECDDVPGTIRQIMSKIPSLVELEVA